MERWRGRTALVTGASSGIGKRIAVDLLKHGMNVVACARRVDAVQSISSEVTGDGVGELMAVKCDVGKEEEILDMFEKIKASKLGGVDVCINNAGISLAGKLADGLTEDWRSLLNVNVLGLAICTREALKSMKERGVDDGHIIHMSSIAGHQVVEGVGMYCATKHAVRALTEGLRLELLAEKSGIRVTEISPGLVKTDIIKTVFRCDEATASGFLAANNHLVVDDVSNSVLHALSAPRHVQIHDIIIHPVAQPSAP